MEKLAANLTLKRGGPSQYPDASTGRQYLGSYVNTYIMEDQGDTTPTSVAQESTKDKYTSKTAGLGGVSIMYAVISHTIVIFTKGEESDNTQENTKYKN